MNSRIQIPTSLGASHEGMVEMRDGGEYTPEMNAGFGGNSQE